MPGNHSTSETGRRAGPAHVLDQVVGEGIVFVEDEDHDAILRPGRGPGSRPGARLGEGSRLLPMGRGVEALAKIRTGIAQR
jgi:hypothetical protein